MYDDRVLISYGTRGNVNRGQIRLVGAPEESSDIEARPCAGGTWYEAIAAYAPLGILPGDLVLHHPNSEWPLEVVRSLPVGKLAVFRHALAIGALRLPNGSGSGHGT